MVATTLVFYNVIHVLKRVVLCANESIPQLQKLREKLFVLPAQLSSCGKQALVSLSIKPGKFSSELPYIRYQIEQLPRLINGNAGSSN